MHDGDTEPRRPAIALRIRIGTSGWQYADWRGVLYERGLPQREWLRRYAEVFDTVELNYSFYRLPSVESFVAWREAVPRGFLIAPKMSRYLTHVRGLREPEDPVRRFVERASHLGDHLGPIVVQLPPTRQKDAGSLERTLAAFPRRQRVALEFRHESWFSDDVRALLEAHDAALVWADRDGRLRDPDWITASWMYVRMHGGRGPSGNYGARVIASYADRLAALDLEAFVYFNNDSTGNAVRNARALARRLGIRGPR